MDTRKLRRLVGIELRRRRESEGLSLHELADKCNTSYTHLWRVENARVSVGIDLLCRISTAMDMPLDTFFGSVYEAYVEQRQAAPDAVRGARASLGETSSHS